MKSFGYEHRSENWHLFIDANKRSFKAVLLHNGNEYRSIPITHAGNMKECYAVTIFLIDKMNYKSLQIIIFENHRDSSRIAI